jgi:hypothetical protein
MILFKAVKTPEQERQGCHEYEERCHEHVPDTHEASPPLLQLLKKVNTMLLFESKLQSRGTFIHLHSEGSQKLSPSLHESREVDDILLVNILCAGTIPTTTTNIYATNTIL